MSQIRGSVQATILFFFISVALSAAAPVMEKQDLGEMGIAGIPADWQPVERGEGHYSFASADGQTRVVFQILEKQDVISLESYALQRAGVYGLPRFFRRIERKMLDQAGADDGGFVLGTVVIPAGAADSLESKPRIVESSADSTFPSPSNPARDNPPSRIQEEKQKIEYRMVVVYGNEQGYYEMDAASTDLPGGPDILFRIHRTWTLKK